MTAPKTILIISEEIVIDSMVWLLLVDFTIIIRKSN
jgi:hypothetical protein